MLTLDNLKAVDNTATASSSSSLDVKISSLSGDINGKFGAFRQLTVGDKTFNVDSKRVSGATMFTPNCNATITLNSYKKADGTQAVVISQVAIQPPQASGYFIMK